jgi:hypothetical protein
MPFGPLFGRGRLARPTVADRELHFVRRPELQAQVIATGRAIQLVIHTGNGPIAL